MSEVRDICGLLVQTCNPDTVPVGLNSDHNLRVKSWTVACGPLPKSQLVKPIITTGIVAKIFFKIKVKYAEIFSGAGLIEIDKSSTPIYAIWGGGLTSFGHHDPRRLSSGRWKHTDSLCRITHANEEGRPGTIIAIPMRISNATTRHEVVSSHQI